MKNYRGISIISTIPKLYEKMICDRITPHFAKLINEAQHGFIKGSRTETNTVIVVDFFINHLEKGQQVDVIYTDFRKASGQSIGSTLVNCLIN